MLMSMFTWVMAGMTGIKQPGGIFNLLYGLVSSYWLVITWHVIFIITVKAGNRF